MLGANGSGKTTLLRIAAMYEHPSSGTVRVLGESSAAPTCAGSASRSDMHRRHSRLSSVLRSRRAEIVMTAKYAALEPWWHRYDRRRSSPRPATASTGWVSAMLAERTLGTLSSGEQQRVFLARTLMNDPGRPVARRAVGAPRPGRSGATRRRARRSGRPTPTVRRSCWSRTMSTRFRTGSPTPCCSATDARSSQGPIDEALTADTRWAIASRCTSPSNGAPMAGSARGLAADQHAPARHVRAGSRLRAPARAGRRSRAPRRRRGAS